MADNDISPDANQPEPPEVVQSQTAPNRHMTVYIAASIIVIIFVAAAYYIIRPAAPTGPVISPPKANFTIFASDLRLPTPLQFVYSSVISITQCGIPTETSYTLYSQPGLGTTAQQINYSAINHAEPIVEYISVSTFGESYAANFTEEFNNASGYCSPALKSNTTYRQTTASFSGLQGYLLTLSNFTDAGLALAQVNYTPSSKPNVSLEISTVLYKNYSIRLAIGTFAGHEDTATLIRYTNLTVDALKAEYG